MKKVFIMQGIPGSGKTTIAHKLAQDVICRGIPVTIVSADDFFMQNGNYNFDVEKLNEAHCQCFREFLQAVQNDNPVIIVDNTNSRDREIAPYMLAGKAFGYAVTIVRVSCHPEIALKRNKHNVPEEKINEMFERIFGPVEYLPQDWKVKVIDNCDWKKS